MQEIWIYWLQLSYDLYAFVIYCLQLTYYFNAFVLVCFQTQVEVALAAADGDLNVAVEILMSQQVWFCYFCVVWDSSCLILPFVLPLHKILFPLIIASSELMRAWKLVLWFWKTRLTTMFMRHLCVLIKSFYIFLDQYSCWWRQSILTSISVVEHL